MIIMEDSYGKGILNHYTCPRCNYYWEDEWDCEVEDDCPECGLRHISPEKSEKL